MSNRFNFEDINFDAPADIRLVQRNFEKIELEAALNSDVGTIAKQPSPLPIAHGGTGMTTNPSMLTDLASTTAQGVFQGEPRPGITGVLGVANGGTGATNASGIRDAAGFNYVVGTGTIALGLNSQLRITTERRPRLVVISVNHSDLQAARGVYGHAITGRINQTAFEIVGSSNQYGEAQLHIYTDGFAAIRTSQGYNNAVLNVRYFAIF